MKSITIKNSITSRDFIVNKFFNEIDDIKLLTTDEEVDLAIKIKNGDENAAQKLVKYNTKFIVSIAKQYEGQGMELPDLINEGCIGMIKAAKRFDETKGFKFITYAVWWVRQAILESLCKNKRFIKLPPNKVNLISRFNKVYAELEQKLERNPSEQEIKDSYLKKYNESLTKDSYDAIITDIKMRSTVSMDYKMTEESIPLSDTIADDTDFVIPENESVSSVLKTAISTLKPQEKDVMTLYLEGLNMVKIGDKLGLTRQRIEQVKSKAIKKLQKNNDLRELVA